MYCILTMVFPLSTTPNAIHTTCPLPKIHSSSVLPQKRAGLPGISTKHDITSYKKNTQEPSYQAWAKQPSRTKMVLRVDKRVRDALPHFH